MNNKFLIYGATLIALHTSLLLATVKEISSVDEYKKIKEGEKPAIVVFNSPSCDACVKMEPFIKAASENPEFQDAEFYTVNTHKESLKELEKTEKIPAYPTTFFIKAGEKTRMERGGMCEKEVNDITYEFIHGKKRPQAPRKMHMKR